MVENKNNIVAVTQWIGKKIPPMGACSRILRIPFLLQALCGEWMFVKTLHRNWKAYSQPCVPHCPIKCPVLTPKYHFFLPA